LGREARVLEVEVEVEVELCRWEKMVRRGRPVGSMRG
jgi:hypothetical protein